MAYPQPQASAPPYAYPAAMSDPQADLEGVGNLKVGSLLGLLVQAMVWIGFLIFYLIYSAISNSTTIYGTTNAIPSWITPNTFYIAVGLLAGGLFIGIVSFVFFYLGFRRIKRAAPDFGAPTTLMIIGLIGYLMAAIGLVVIIGTFISAINNAVAGTVTAGSASLDISAILSGIALIGLGAILALIGVIGLVLGNWRAGGRYGESTIKIGAILSILPYVSIVGYILLLVGYMKAGSKLRSGWSPGGMAPMAAPAGYAPPPGSMPPPGQMPPSP